jgi:hypothetical protein
MVRLIPSELIKGESSSWTDDPTTDAAGNAVNSSTHTLKYQIRGTASLTLTAAADGLGWLTTLSPTNSDTLTAGTYFWQAIAEAGSAPVTSRIVLGSGQILVKAALSAASTGYDGRSQSKQDLDAVQSAIRSIISGGAVAEYTIGNRQLRKIPMADLLILESKLKSDVARESAAEKIKDGQYSPRNMFVRFRR